MKKKVLTIISVIAFSVITAKALDVSGYITNDSVWSLADSPINLIGNLTIRNGATLTIDNGVIVNQNNHKITIGYYNSPSTLNANGVEFNNSGTNDQQVAFHYGSNGSIANSTFNNVLLYIDEGTPTLDNNTFRNVEYPIYMDVSGKPVIGTLNLEDVTYSEIRLGGTTDGTNTLTALSLPYGLASNINIRNNDTLFIAKGVHINQYSRDIYVGYSSYTGSLIADSVFFASSYSNDRKLNITNCDTVSLTNCVFDNVILDISSNSIYIANDSIKNVSFPIKLTPNANPTIENISLLNVENEEIGISGTTDGNVSLEKRNLPYGLSANLYVYNGDTLFIDPGVQLNFHSSYIRAGYTNTTGVIIADGANFNSDNYYNRYIEFYDGSGSISNCNFDNVYIELINGDPSIENDSIKNVTYPLISNPSGSPTINNLRFKDITNEKIGLKGTLSGSALLKKQELPYALSSSVYVRNGDTLQLEKGIEIDFGSQVMYIGYSNDTAILIADSVTFYSSYGYDRSLNIKNKGSIALISNSTLDNVYIDVENGHAFLENDSIIGVDLPISQTIGSNVEFEGIYFKDVTNEAIGLRGNLSGTDTLKTGEYPYVLSNSINVGNNDTLFISKGVGIDFSNYSLNIGYYSQPGTLVADSVRFYSSSYYERPLNLKYGSIGIIENAVLDNVYIVTENGTPMLKNDSIINVSIPIILNIGDSLIYGSLNFKEVEYEAIHLKGTLGSDYTLRKYPEFEYRLAGNVTVDNNATMTIEPGLKLDLNGYGLVLGSYYSAGDIVADSVFFYYNSQWYEMYLKFYQSTEKSKVTRCTFDNVYLQIQDNGNVEISESNFLNSNIGIKNYNFSTTIQATNNYWGHASGPYHEITNPNAIGASVSDSVNYRPWSTSYILPGVESPEPVITPNPSIVNVFVGDTTENITFYLENNGGEAGLTEFEIILSRSLNLVEIDPYDSISSFYRGDTLINDDEVTIAKNQIHKIYYHQFGENPKEITVKVAKVKRGNSWIKYRASVLPANIDTSIVDISHLLSIYPTAGDIDQEGYFVSELPVLSPLDGAITSIRENEGHVYMTVIVDTFGIGIASLDTTNFVVYDNNELQTDYFEVIPPSEGQGSRLIDIVFIVDNSGSMSDEQDEVGVNVLNFVDSLSEYGADIAFGLCRYGGTYAVIEDNGILTTDTSYFKNDVWARNSTSLGGIEKGYDAIIESVSKFNYRPGSQKIIILITDETPDQGIYTMEEALTICDANNMTFFGFTLPELFETMEPIAEENDGEIFNILDDFSEVISIISKMVGNTYIVHYLINDLSEPMHVVEVNVTYGENTIVLIDTIYLFAAPVITRTSETIDLEEQSWPENQALTISVEVTDLMEPFTQMVTLYYKNTSNNDYDFVIMNNTESNIWSATIPVSHVLEPGIDYYITATDGEATSSSPKVDPADKPFQIAILPNYKPQITHTPVTEYTPGDLITLNATITDETTTVDSIAIYYRKSGQLLYTVDSMTHSTGDDYVYNIVTDENEEVALEYYIAAWDNYGVKATVGYADKPLIIYVTGTGLSNSMLSDNDFAMYPNPAKNEVHIISNYISSSSVIKIFSTNGQHIVSLMLSKTGEGYLLNVEQLLPGTYYYQVDGKNKQTFNGSLIIER